MNAIIDAINSAGQAFVQFMLPMFIQSSVLILILLLLDVALRRRVRAVFRYWLWMLVLVKLVLPPSLWSPVSIGTWLGETLEPPHIAVDEPLAPQPQMPPAEWQPQAKLGDGTPVVMTRTHQMQTSAPEMPGVAAASDSLPMETPAPMPTPEGALSGPRIPSPAASTLSWPAVVLLVWLAVALALLLLLFQRAWFVRGLVAQSRRAGTPSLKTALDQCRSRMGVARPIAMCISPNASSPAVCGLLRPVILIPQNLAPRLQPHDLQAVLLHELAHVKRGDLWINLVQTLLQIVYFYNPLLWLANAMIRRAREQAVDEAVLVAMGETAPDYPETLLHVAKLAFHRRPALSLRLIGVVESKSALRSRIKHILARPLPKTAKLGLLGLLAVCLIAALLLPMARASEETVSVVNNGPLDIRLIGVCPDGDGELYDANGKKLNVTMPPLGTSERPWDSNEVRRDFVFEVPDVDEKLVFDSYSHVRPAHADKAVGGGSIKFDPLTDPSRLVLSAEFDRTYPERQGEKAPQDLPVRKVDLTLKYFLGPRGEALCTFTGPFTGGTTVQADDGCPYELTLELTRSSMESLLEFYLTTNQPVERDVPVILYDINGMRYAAFYIGSREGRLRYHVDAVRWNRVAAITVGEQPYEITFQNVVVDYPRHSQRTYPEHLDRVAERLNLTAWSPDDLIQYNLRHLPDIVAVLDVIRSSDLIGKVTEVFYSDSPRLDFTGLDPAIQERIRATAASWVDSPHRTDGIILGLAGHWPEFFDLAIERLQGDCPALPHYPERETIWRLHSHMIAHVLEKRWGLLNASEVQKLKDCIRKTTDGWVLISLFECLEATSSPEATTTLRELAQDEHPWIWWRATEMWCERVSRSDWADDNLPEEMKLRLYLVEDHPVDADVKAKARALLAEQLTPQLTLMSHSVWLASNTRILQQFDRTTVTRIYVDYLRRMRSLIAGRELYVPISARVSLDVAQVVRSLNLWYDVNIGNLGTSWTQRPYGDKQPTHAVLDSVISDVLTWYAANPDRVPRELPLEGQVVDEAGHPIVDAQVTLKRLEDRRTGSGYTFYRYIEVDTCRTDADGRFTFTGLGTHPSYTLDVVAAGFMPRGFPMVGRQLDGRYGLLGGSIIKMRKSDFAGGSVSGGFTPRTSAFLDSVKAVWGLLFEGDAAVEQLGEGLIGLPLTDRARSVMSLADEEARRLNHDYVGTEHILLALARQEDAVSAKVLANLGADLDTLRAEVNKFVQPGTEPVVRRARPRTLRAERAMQYAKEEARILGHEYIGTEHILLALLRDKEGVAAQVLARLGITETQIRAQVLTFVRSTSQDAGSQSEPIRDDGTDTDVVLPAADHAGLMLDLASGKFVRMPDLPAGTPTTEVAQAIRESGRGDLLYDCDEGDRLLVLMRDATSEQAEQIPDEPFKIQAHLVGDDLPEVLTVTTAEGRRYEVTILAADDEACTLKYSLLSNDEGAGGGALVEPHAAASPGVAAKLPNGVTVEFLAYSQLTAEGLRWWTAEGKPTTIPNVYEADVEGLGTVLALRVAPPETQLVVQVYRGPDSQNIEKPWQLAGTSIWLLPLGDERNFANLRIITELPMPAVIETIPLTEENLGQLVEVNRCGIASIVDLQVVENPSGDMLTTAMGYPPGLDTGLEDMARRGESSFAPIVQFWYIRASDCSQAVVAFLDKEGRTHAAKAIRLGSADSYRGILSPNRLAGIMVEAAPVHTADVRLRNISLTPERVTEIQIEPAAKQGVLWRLSYRHLVLESLTNSLLGFRERHGGRFPGSLADLQSSHDPEAFRWITTHIAYVGQDKSHDDDPRNVIAYDQILLAEGRGTYVLYSDGQLEFEGPVELAELGITVSTETNSANTMPDAVTAVAQAGNTALAGQVLDPTGAPVAGAQVAWIDAERSVSITDGRLMAPRFGDRGKGPIVETDERGYFRFEEEPNDGFSLVAAHEAGFALVSSEQFAKDRMIRLEPWGRVEGRVAQGREPLEGKIWMGGLPNSTWFEHRRDYRYETLCDTQGRFTFKRVPPGWFEVGYLTRVGDSVSSHTSRTPIVVEAGQTATVTLGGEGRPVIGRFVPPPDWEGPIYFGAGLRALDTARPDRPRPADYDQMTQRRQQDWYKQWRKTPEAQAYYDAIWQNPNQRHYTFRIAVDGTFRIEDVIPGRYDLDVWLEERLSGGRPEEFGGYSGTIEVPPMDQAYSDDPLDVGDLVLRLRRPLHVGDLAPLFEAQTLDGKPIRLADYRGRFVLLSFWHPASHPELDRLKELHATYGGTGRLQIIGLGGSDTMDEVKKFVAEQDVLWPQIYFGQEWDQGIAKQYGLSGLPCILLIDPDGKIVATWLREQKLTDTVRQAIENAQIGVSGRILDPNGAPVPGAQVALCTLEKGIAVTAGRLGSYSLGSQHAKIRETDGDGGFVFEQRPEDFELVVACDSGFARLTDEQFAASPVIRLQRWGRVEGTIHIGRKPGVDRILRFQEFGGTEIGNWINHNDWAQADEDGRFVFEKVAPRWAEIGYIGGTRSRSSRWTNGRPVHILPGETVHVAIGATGRPLVGRLAVPPGYQMPTDLREVGLVFRTVSPEMPFPEDYVRMTQDQKYEWRQQWLSTPEGQDYFVSVRHNPNHRCYAAVLETDDTFCIEDMIPGRYELTVFFQLEPPRQLIILSQGTIDVPAMAEAYSDEPLDLGELVLDTTQASVIPGLL